MSTTSSARRPGRPRTEDAPVAVEAMLAAALRAFATHGYDGVSVNALSRQLGVSHNLPAPALRLKGRAVARRRRLGIRRHGP